MISRKYRIVPLQRNVVSDVAWGVNNSQGPVRTRDFLAVLNANVWCEAFIDSLATAREPVLGEIGHDRAAPCEVRAKGVDRRTSPRAEPFGEGRMVKMVMGHDDMADGGRAYGCDQGRKMGVAVGARIDDAKRIGPNQKRIGAKMGHRRWIGCQNKP